MSNENCLAGVKCPKCGQEERFLIVSTILADVTDGGADIADGSDMHWDDTSMTRCPECDRDGPLAAFRETSGNVDHETPNQQRASYVTDMLAINEHYGDTEPTNLQDLLSDLMHLCRGKGYDFAEILRVAKDNFQAEVMDAEFEGSAA